MATRGILIIGTNIYNINHDADIYAKKLFMNVLKRYKPKSAKEFIKYVNNLYDDPTGGSIMGSIMVSPRAWPIAHGPDPYLHEAAFKVNLTTNTVHMRKLQRGTTKFPKF